MQRFPTDVFVYVLDMADGRDPLDVDHGSNKRARHEHSAETIDVATSSNQRPTEFCPSAPIIDQQLLHVPWFGLPRTYDKHLCVTFFFFGRRKINRIIIGEGKRHDLLFEKKGNPTVFLYMKPRNRFASDDHCSTNTKQHSIHFFQSYSILFRFFNWFDVSLVN